ncbi:MAG: acylphosphatase [Lachnospiraceae bacterium]|nr:acylphosphatase [Lachnospiraceae bacterium]
MNEEYRTKKIRKHIVFTGHVQGVGFRFRLRSSAIRFGCTGWCHNEWDGSVVLEIQGTEKDIDDTILAATSGRFIGIDNMAVKSMEVNEKEYGFRVM